MSTATVRSVTIIPPTINPLTHISMAATRKRRVAGYARVSTDSDEQFTSGLCGSTYKRVTCRGKHFWNCTTFQTKGKAECPAKKIPAETLEALACEVLGTEILDPDMVRSKITMIRAEKNNVVVFCMDDGSEIVKRWKDRSRAESWSPEMREQARQRALQTRRVQK